MAKTTQEKILGLAQFIEDNAHETLALDELAQQVAISPFHLQRKFKEIFGVTPKQFQNAVRIQRLKQSLKQGDEIFEAIFDAGFGSTSRIYEQVDARLGMTLSSYKAGGEGLQISFALRKISLGFLLMAATERGVCFVHLGDSFASLVEALHREFPRADLSPTDDAMDSELDLWIDALEEHLAGNGPQPEVPLHLFGTAFQLKVWKFLASVQGGATISYKTVAQGINNPAAVRAVANACGANRLAVLIPCHRVLRGDGRLSGYRWGTERKRQLLELEKSLGVGSSGSGP